MAPRVTVCVPAFNGARWLAECLRSAQAQTFLDFELLVVDDASTDATLSIAREFARHDRRFRVESNKARLGLVGNWNRCSRLARGRWLKFLFQDDLLAPDCLSRMLTAAGPRDSVVACRRRIRFEPGVSASLKNLYRKHLSEHSLSKRFPGKTRISPESFAALLLRFPGFNCVGEPSAVMIRAGALLRHGLFNPDLAMLCDWELVARLAVHSGLRYLDAPLAVFRVHPGAESAENRRRPYRAEVIDELLIRHDLAYAPVYAPVRRLAARLRPPADLENSLAAAVRVARGEARRFASDSRRPDPGAPAAFRWALDSRPKLGELLRRPPGPRVPAADPRRIAALKLLAELNADRLPAGAGIWT